MLESFAVYQSHDEITSIEIVSGVETVTGQMKQGYREGKFSMFYIIICQMLPDPREIVRMGQEYLVLCQGKCCARKSCRYTSIKKGCCA